MVCFWKGCSGSIAKPGKIYPDKNSILESRLSRQYKGSFTKLSTRLMQVSKYRDDFHYLLLLLFHKYFVLELRKKCTSREHYTLVHVVIAFEKLEIFKKANLVLSCYSLSKFKFADKDLKPNFSYNGRNSLLLFFFY